MSRTKKKKPVGGQSQNKSQSKSAASAEGKKGVHNGVSKASELDKASNAGKAAGKKSRGPARAAKEKERKLKMKKETAALTATGFPKKKAEGVLRKNKGASVAECWAYGIEHNMTRKQPPLDLMKDKAFKSPTLLAKMDENIKWNAAHPQPANNTGAAKSAVGAQSSQAAVAQGEAALAKAGKGPHIGYLKLFMEAKGCGFISCEATHSAFGCDVFLHKNELGRIGDVGVTVSFHLTLKNGRPQAEQVELVDDGTILPGADEVYRKIRVTCPTCNYVLPKSNAFGDQKGDDCPRCSAKGSGSQNSYKANMNQINTGDSGYGYDRW